MNGCSDETGSGVDLWILAADFAKMQQRHSDQALKRCKRGIKACSGLKEMKMEQRSPLPEGTHKELIFWTWTTLGILGPRWQYSDGHNDTCSALLIFARHPRSPRTSGLPVTEVCFSRSSLPVPFADPPSFLPAALPGLNYTYRLRNIFPLLLPYTTCYFGTPGH